MNRRIWTILVGLTAACFSFSACLAGDVPSQSSKETKAEFEARMKWWQEARLGLFIHWGPISLKGTEIGWSRGKQVPVQEYDNLYKQFNPTKFDAGAWVRLAKDAGMKYLILTTKHHDGFCLWNTQTTPYNIMATPFKRDVVRELSDACKKEGITFCTYYSILDWYQPDYNPSSRGGPGYALPQGQTPDPNRYFETIMKPQLRELVTGYGPLGIMWFDGEWEEPWTHARGLDLYAFLRNMQPTLIINNRVDKGRKGMEGITRKDQDYAGDYDTPEQRVGSFQTDRPWETCITLCKQWAWKPDDPMKSLEECIRLIVNTAGGDGNLLLNIGPMPDGQIETRQADRLLEIGKWLQTHGESIYATRGGPFKPDSWGAATHRGNRIYVHVLNLDKEILTLPPIPQKITAAGILNGAPVHVMQTDKGIEISLGLATRDPLDTVVVLDLNEAVGK